MANSYLHSGDLGDVIYGLKVMKELNDPDSKLYLVTRPFTKAFTEDRIKAITPLCAHQDYIGEVIAGEPKEPISHDFSTFRGYSHPYGVTIPDLQARWLKLPELPYKPWLTVPDAEKTGEIFFHKTPRYNSNKFPWRQLADYFGDRVVVIGLPDEMQNMDYLCGRTMRKYHATSLLDLAVKINSGMLYVGNQSSPMAMAVGLGVKIIQETYWRKPDCLFEGIQHVIDGNVTVNGDIITGYEYTDLMCSPHGGWQLLLADGKFFSGINASTIVRNVRRYNGMSDSEIKNELLKQTSLRLGEIKRNYPSMTFNIAIGSKQSHNTIVPL